MDNQYVVKSLDDFFCIVYKFNKKNISLDEVYNKIYDIDIDNLPDNLKYEFLNVIDSYLILAKYTDNNRKNYIKDFIKGFIFTLLHIFDSKDLFKFIKKDYRLKNRYGECLYKYLSIISNKYINKETFIDLLNKYKFGKFQKFVLEAAWDNNFS